jgi:hypothetical protein
MMVHQDDAPALSAKNLRGGQAGWAAPDDRHIEM